MVITCLLFKTCHLLKNSREHTSLFFFALIVVAHHMANFLMSKQLRTQIAKTKGSKKEKSKKKTKNKKKNKPKQQVLHESTLRVWIVYI